MSIASEYLEREILSVHGQIRAVSIMECLG